MRRVVQHIAGAIGLATLMALLIPSSPQTLKDYPIVTASAASNATVAAKPGATAATDGRWKLGGDGSCYFDPDDSGPDQCSENQGRWKLGGDGSCYWDPADSGANQCEPATTEGIEATDGHAAVSAQLRSAEFHSRI